jgi:hypothetical protein
MRGLILNGLEWLWELRSLPEWERRGGVGEAASMTRFYIGEAWLYFKAAWDVWTE